MKDTFTAKTVTILLYMFFFTTGLVETYHVTPIVDQYILQI